MISRVLAVACFLAASGGAAAAQEPETQGGQNRYSFYKVADGFLRLDLQTGQAALCSKQAVGWACLAVAEDRAVLENEITRLHRENARLKEDLLSHGLPLPAGVAPEPEGSKGRPHLPGVGDLQRIVTAFGRLWQRFIEAVGDVENRWLHRS